MEWLVYDSSSCYDIGHLDKSIQDLRKDAMLALRATERKYCIREYRID